MQTSYAQNTLSSINEDATALRAEYAARGIRDIITTMAWPNGMTEVTGSFAPRRQFGDSACFGLKSVADYCRNIYGKGTIRLVSRGNIQGRPTATYEVK